jgi:hypothetical protein
VRATLKKKTKGRGKASAIAKITAAVSLNEKKASLQIAD